MILGISGSSRNEETSGTYTLVKAVLEATGCEYELISLRGMNIAGCIACLGCKDDNVCKVCDDMEKLREKIVNADGYVIGSPNYFGGMSALTHAFLERWYQFRHKEYDTNWGKLGVTVGVGGAMGEAPTSDINRLFLYNNIETVASVYGQGTASCFTCGNGELCKMGIPYMLYGEGVKITEEMTPRITKQCDVMKEARMAGRLLANRLTNEHNRKEVTAKVQKKLEKFFTQ